MKYKLLKDLYDCFYTPPELQAQKQEIDECHQALSEVLGKTERIFPGRVDLQRAYVVTGGETKSRTSASSLYRDGAFLSSFRR